MIPERTGRQLAWNDDLPTESRLKADCDHDTSFKFNWSELEQKGLPISNIDRRCPVAVHGKASCDRIFEITLDENSRQADIKRHVTEMPITDMSEPPMTCPACNRQFCWITSSKAHLRTCYPNDRGSGMPILERLCRDILVYQSARVSPPLDSWVRSVRGVQQQKRR